MKHIKDYLLIILIAFFVIWVYLESKKVNQPKTIKINTTLLYDFLPQQTNIVHAEINGIKKSSKVLNPDSKIEFNF